MLLVNGLFGQEQEPWVRFYDTVTDLSGYKDLKGNIRIPAKFTGPASADTFHNIITVFEEVDKEYKVYYLLKDGRKVGKDSVYMFDFMFDCENEGKIIFRDGKKNRVGFLDKNGVAVIPASYNYVSPFRNGMALALRNAKRKCWDEKEDTTYCEHWGWEDGERVLINEKNEVLVDSIKTDLYYINWYSKKVNDPAIDTTLYINLKGTNGDTYSFLDYDKEFGKWFYNTFLPALKSKESLLSDLLFEEIVYGYNEMGALSLERKAYLRSFPNALVPGRFEVNKLKEISLSQNIFEHLLFEKDIFRKYLNSCGVHDRYKYPVYEVIVSYYKKRTKPLSDDAVEFTGKYGIDYQERFEFLRTESGYKLISVSIKNNK